jgi:sodium/bile acid cotransporter 7
VIKYQIILLGIVWNAFCNAFTSGLGLELKHSLVLLTLLPTLHLGSFGAIFKLFSFPFFKLSRQEIVAATFCSSQKTLAFGKYRNTLCRRKNSMSHFSQQSFLFLSIGLPLINTIFEGNPNLAAYVAPLMFIHPLQMTLGSILLPKIIEYTSESEEKKY